MNAEEIDKEKLQNVKVKKVVCQCGKARLLSVIDPLEINGPMKESTKRDIGYWAMRGSDIVTITLEEARQTDLCFDCEHEDTENEFVWNLYKSLDVETIDKIKSDLEDKIFNFKDWITEGEELDTDELDDYQSCQRNLSALMSYLKSADLA